MKEISSITIRKAELCDLPYLYDICLKTGNNGKDSSALYGDQFLIGQFWAAPYVHYAHVHEDRAFCFVADDSSGTAGYILAARDSTHFYDWLENCWLPPLRKKYPLNFASGARTDSEQNLITLIHAPASLMLPPPEILSNYPSHLHIDLLPQLQGKGAGRTLMQTLFCALKEAGSCGVHLGVSKANENAVSFYRHVGFSPIAETQCGFTMGQKIS